MGLFSKWKKAGSISETIEIVKGKHGEFGLRKVGSKEEPSFTFKQKEQISDEIWAFKKSDDGYYTLLSTAINENGKGYGELAKGFEVKFVEPMKDGDRYVVIGLDSGKGKVRYTLMEQDGTVLNYRLFSVGPVVNGVRVVNVDDGKTTGFAYFFENKDSGQLIQNRFDDARNFSYGMGLVKLKNDDKFSFVTSDGKLIKISFEDARNFEKDGFAIVENKGKKYLVGTDGRIMDGSFDEISNVNENNVRFGYIKMNEKGEKYPIKIENGYVKFAEWVKMIKKCPELFACLPHNLFRSKQNTETLKATGYKEALKITHKEKSLVYDEATTLTSKRNEDEKELVNKAVKLQKIINDRIKLAEQEILEEDARIEEESQKIETDCSKLKKKLIARREKEIREADEKIRKVIEERERKLKKIDEVEERVEALNNIGKEDEERSK